jgi:uncharacterized protein (DUF58 family)
MIENTHKPQLTSLLSNEQLARVSRMRVLPNRRLTSRTRGEHRSRASGTSIEFRDYRDYTPGDDMRFVDWNIFARLHRPYLKLYHEEEQMNIVVLVDASSSMQFEGKLARALSLAAAFGVMGLMAVERVFNQRGGEATRMRPRRGRVAMRDLLAFLESIEGGGDAPLEHGIEAMLRVHRGRGIAVILSDFLTHANLRRPFNLLHSAGLEPLGVQVLAPQEIDPALEADLRLVDSETGHTLDVSVGGDLLTLYQEYRQDFQRELEDLCRQRGGRFLSLDASMPLDTVLFDVLRRKGWLR